MMKKNVGGIDKVLRIITGMVLLIFGLFGPLSTGIRTVVTLVGAIVLFTGIFGV